MLGSQLSARGDLAGREAEAQLADAAPRQGGTGQRSGNRDSGIARESFVWPFWRDEAAKKELGLTDDKAARIEELYRSRTDRMRPWAAERDKEEAILNRMVEERVATPGAFELQAARLESLTAELRKSRWVMLYRLYRELEPEQYQKLRKIYAERRANRGRGGSGS